MTRTIQFLAWLVLLQQGWPQNYHPPHIVDRMPGQGKLWLSWSPERRQGFSGGYLWGYDTGFGQGCVVYFDANSPGTKTIGEHAPLDRCMARRPDYSKGPDYYAAQVTAYYKKYPGDLDMPIRWLFLALCDQEAKTPEAIHRAWINHEPL